MASLHDRKLPNQNLGPFFTSLPLNYTETASGNDPERWKEYGEEKNVQIMLPYPFRALNF